MKKHANAFAKPFVLAALLLSLSAPNLASAHDDDPEHPAFRWGISGAGGVSSAR
jgi:hypothetical protein